MGSDLNVAPYQEEYLKQAGICTLDHFGQKLPKKAGGSELREPQNGTAWAGKNDISIK
jgi:hypothetical protein